jgi:hypothetical protein
MEKNIYLIDNNFYNNKCNYVVITMISLMLLLKYIIFESIHFLVVIISSFFKFENKYF